MLDVADRIVVIERGRIEREVDAHAVQAGGLAELLGMGEMRMHAAVRRRAQARRRAAPAARAAAPSRPTSAVAPSPRRRCRAGDARIRRGPPPRSDRRPRPQPFPR